jgi:hypothetical protein
MESFLMLQDNPLQTRDDLNQALVKICAAVKPYYSKGCARLRLGSSSAHYPSGIAEMEGFSRILWGIVPQLAGGYSSDLWDICLEGIRNGTDPQHEEYWGKIGNYDQRMVEMAAFGYALAMIPDKIWDPLTEKERHNLAAWLGQINHFETCDCNWHLFCTLVNMGLKKVGAPYSEERMNQSLDRIDSFYLSNGWYSDGQGRHCDYYTAFAIHFYSLLYAKIMGKEDPHRASLIKERAAVFAREFIYWFSENGAALPYGRSLTYRFAQAAFWGALEFAGASPYPSGIAKGILLRNLRWWFQKPIFSCNGILKVGYAYENQFMTESYNSPGSPYWALKSFLPLALDVEHPFWKSEELPLPPLENVHVQQEPHFVICRGHGNITAFTSGYSFHDDHTHTVPKYEKFAYSTAFGFSVPRGPYGVKQGAFDSTLALSDGQNLFRLKTENESCKIENGRILMRWKPWDDVEVETCLIPGTPWHIRIHRICTCRKLTGADGGFALPVENGGIDYDTPSEKELNKGLLLSNSAAACGSICLHGKGRAESVWPLPDTNLLCQQTVIPTVKLDVEPGEHLYITAFYGEPAPYIWKENSIPCVKRENGSLNVYLGQKMLGSVPLKEQDK